MQSSDEEESLEKDLNDLLYENTYNKVDKLADICWNPFLKAHFNQQAFRLSSALTEVTNEKYTAHNMYCSVCFTNFEEMPVSSRILPKKKKNKFLIKLLRKKNDPSKMENAPKKKKKVLVKELTKYQQKYIKKHTRTTNDISIQMKCSYCDKTLIKRSNKTNKIKKTEEKKNIEQSNFGLRKNKSKMDSINVKIQKNSEKKQRFKMKQQTSSIEKMKMKKNMAKLNAIPQTNKSGKQNLKLFLNKLSS